MNNGKLALIPKRLKRCEGWMQSEETIKIKHRFARNIDARPHRVILRLPVRHNDIQTVSGATLKNHHQALRARAWFSRAPCGARQKAWHSRRSDYGERAITKKNPTCDGHKMQLSATGN
jgi:hypothetical protein